jgi:hypothetical protein
LRLNNFNLEVDVCLQKRVKSTRTKQRHYVYQKLKTPIEAIGNISGRKLLYVYKAEQMAAIDTGWDEKKKMFDRSEGFRENVGIDWTNGFGLLEVSNECFSAIGRFNKTPENEKLWVLVNEMRSKFQWYLR